MRINQFVFSTLLLLITTTKAFTLPLNIPNLSSQSYYKLLAKRNQGRFIGYNTSYSSLDLITFPFQSPSYTPLLDMRAHCFDNGNWAANAGLGCRFTPSFTSLIFGINVYYDYRRAHRHDFNQAGFGLEILGSIWSFRLNTYLPVGKNKILRKFCRNDYPGGYFVQRKKFLQSLKGFHSEIEYLLAKTPHLNVILALGGYYYKRDRCKCQGSIYGSELRLTTQLNNPLEINLYAIYDRYNHTKILGEFIIKFPFFEPNLEDSKIYKSIYRHEIIPLENQNRWKWNY